MTADTLPAGYSTRSATMDDLPAVFEVVVACDVDELGEPDTTLEDLRADWEDIDLTRDAFLVADPHGKVVGYAGLGNREHVRINAEAYVHPQHRGRSIGTHLVQLIERRAREHVVLAPPDARVVVNNYITSRNEAAAEVLRAQDYTLVRRHWRMLITMDDPPPAPEWPEGVWVRNPVPGEDDRAVYEAIGEAFVDMWEYIKPPFDEWRRFMMTPRTFDPTLWWIADDGGEIAGVALCLYRADDLGWVRSLGVRRPWRRKGLGHALLRQAFGEFYRRGTRKVGLGVDSQSLTGATRLYERAGMRVDKEFDQYQKELRAGKDLTVQEAR